MNTVTLDTATYNEMSNYARQNNVSIAEMLKSNWHDFLEYVSTKKTAKSKDREQEFLNCFSGSDWDNDKSPSEVVDEYRRNSYSDLSRCSLRCRPMAMSRQNLNLREIELMKWTCLLAARLCIMI